MSSKVPCLRHDIATAIVKRNPSLFVRTYKILSLIDCKTLKNTEGAIKYGQSRETGKTQKNKTNKIECCIPLYVNKHK